MWIYLNAPQTMQPHVSFVPFDPVHTVVAIVTLNHIMASVSNPEVCLHITCAYALLYPHSIDSRLSQLSLHVKQTVFQMLPH